MCVLYKTHFHGHSGLCILFRDLIVNPLYFFHREHMEALMNANQLFYLTKKLLWKCYLKDLIMNVYRGGGLFTKFFFLGKQGSNFFGTPRVTFGRSSSVDYLKCSC